MLVKKHLCLLQYNSNIYFCVFCQGCSDTSGFLQAVFGFILPLAYEYDPTFVLLVRMPGNGVSDSMWQQLTGLLQGFAQGHTLVLIQVRRLGHVSEKEEEMLSNCAIVQNHLYLNVI